MRFILPAAAALLFLIPAMPVAKAQTKPDNVTPLAPTPEAKSLVQQLLREGKIMRASEAKRGMKGYALSVFQGTKVEKFNLEVLGTLERVNGGGDLVMIKVLDGPVVTRQSGIIQGMSGSPVYINGKLLGAIAIGFGFPKEPIGGITPITQMIEGALPDNAPKADPVKVAQTVTTPNLTQRLARFSALKQDENATEQTSAEQTSTEQTFSAPPRSIEGAYLPREPLQIGERRVTRVAVSSDLRIPDWSQNADGFSTMAMRPCTRLVLLSGVSPDSLPRWKNLFSPYGLTPMIGGGAMSRAAQAQVFGTPSTKTGVEANLAPGAAIGVQMASGDIDISGVGTVTYRLGNRLLAFGHPMFNLGGVSMPMTTAYVHDIFPAYDISFKLASPIRVVGELQSDTNFAIGGTVGRVAQTVPMHIKLIDPAKKIDRDWNTKIIKDPLFTPQLATNIAVEALESTLGLDSGKTVNVAFRMRLKDGTLINRRNTVYSDGQVIQGALSEMLTALSLTQQNPFEKGDIAGIDLAVEIVPERKTATIRAITADRNKVKAGEKVTISVELEPTGEPDVTITKRFVVPVPEDSPNGLMRVAVGPANSYWSLRSRVGGTPPDPGNLPELLEAYEQVGASNVLELQASTPDRFLLVDRKKVSDPPPLWGRLVPQTPSSSLRAFNETVDQKQPSEYVLSGQQFLVLPVESLRPSDRNEPVESGQNTQNGNNAFDDGDDGMESNAPMSIGGDDEMATDWTRYDAPGNYRRTLAKLRLQIPSKGNEPPTLPGAAPTPPPPVVTPTTPANPTLAPTPEPSPTPDPKADSIARPPGRWIQQTAADFGSGNFYGSVVRDDGAIVPGPRGKELVSSAEPIAWSLAVAPDSTLYVGTGFNARLLQIRKGVSRVMYQGDEVAITALALGTDGTLYAGASPGGRVYRFRPNGQRDLLLQTRETFVHALKITPQGLYIGTGGPRAALYKLDNPATVSANPIAKPLVVLPQTHLRSMDVSGTDIYAGAGDDAVLYRIDSAGQATALYQATNPPTRSGTITIQSGGQTQVISVGPEGTPVQNGATNSVSTNPLLRRGGITGGNEITAIVADENGVYFGTLGSSSVYRYTVARGVEEYWKAPMGAIYALTMRGGNLYAGCDAGSVWRLSGEQGSVQAARVLDADQPQVLALAAQGNELYAATANNAAVYQIGAGPDGAGNEYDSDIFDAKGVVKWGALRTLGTGVAIQTRSGNTTDPDKTWSDWENLRDDKIVSPAGRYLQYRARFEPNGSLARIEALYRAPNRAPKVEFVSPAGGEAFSGKKTLTWKGTDPDGDALRYKVELSQAGAPFENVLDVTPTDAKITLKTEKYPDGTYRARVRASDAARNPEDPLADESISQPFTIDNTAPALSDLTLTKSGGQAAFSNDAIWKLSAQGSDATSTLAGAEWRIKPVVDAKADKAKDKVESGETKNTATKVAATPLSTTETEDDADDGEATKTDDVKPDADALAEIAAAKKTRSLWQAIGAADGLFDGKSEGLLAILDSAFSPIPLTSGMEIEVRLRDAAGNQTVKTLKLP